MRDKDYPHTALQVKSSGGRLEKVHWLIDDETKQLIKDIDEISQMLFGLKVSRAVIARRALQLLHEELSLLVMEGASPKFTDPKHRQSSLIRYMARVEAAREAFFQSANRIKDTMNPKYGRLPSCKSLTGYELNKGAIAKKMAKRLGYMVALERSDLLQQGDKN